MFSKSFQLGSDVTDLCVRKTQDAALRKIRPLGVGSREEKRDRKILSMAIAIMQVRGDEVLN